MIAACASPANTSNPETTAAQVPRQVSTQVPSRQVPEQPAPVPHPTPVTNVAPSKPISESLAQPPLVQPPPAQPPPIQQPPSLSANQQRDLDSLARRILARELFQKKNLADIGLLPKRGPIFVLSSASTPLTEHAFPKVGKQRLKLISLAELQRLADQSGTTVAYITLDISIDSDTAYVRSGVDITLPSSSNASKLCCCTQTKTWVKKRGRWKPDSKSRSRVMCS